MNKLLWSILAVPLACCGAPPPDDTLEAEAFNVNSRYTIESVQVSGPKNPHLSTPLRSELDEMVGQKLDDSHLQELARRIKRELHVPDVSVRVGKGAVPESVVVNFEIAKEHDQDFDLHVPKFAYHSRQGWSGEVNATTKIAGNAFSFDLLSDGDLLPERFTGFRAGYERAKLGTDRLRLRFLFSSFHSQWDRATLDSAAPGEIYRNRQSFAPEATVVLARPLELSFGTDFARFQLSVPSTGEGAKTESSNAVVTTLRYHPRWGSASNSSTDSQEQELDAAYSVRAATGILQSDTSFTRHAVDARYKYHRGHSLLDLAFLAGHITGAAPLFERFVLGNSRTLRGWNKYDLDPRGGSNVVHGSVEYSYRGFLTFYDTGAVWDRPHDREQKQSLGCGFRTKDGFQIAVAFPLRNGHVDPIFYAGVGF